MFDTFLPSSPVACPRCKRELGDFQSKDGACLLLTYKQGDSVRDPAVPDPEPGSIQDLMDWERGREQLPVEFEMHTICQNCEAWVEARGRTADGIWIETVDVRAGDLGGGSKTPVARRKKAKPRKRAPARKKAAAKSRKKRSSAR